MTIRKNPSDETLDKAHAWVNEIEVAFGGDSHGSYLALRATLHALRDALGVDQVAHLSAQMPMLVRGAFFEG